MLIIQIIKTKSKYFLFSPFSRRKFEIRFDQIKSILGKHVEGYDYYEWFYVTLKDKDQIWKVVKKNDTEPATFLLEHGGVTFNVLKKFGCGKTKLTCASVDKTNMKNPLGVVDAPYVQPSAMFLKYSHIVKFESTFLKYQFYASDLIRITAKQKVVEDISCVVKNSYYLPSGFICPLRITKIEVDAVVTVNAVSNLMNLKELKSISEKTRKDLKTKRLTKICFDCETIQFEGRLVPYLIYAKVIPQEALAPFNISLCDNSADQNVEMVEQDLVRQGPPLLFFPAIEDFLWSYPLGVDFKRELFDGGIKFAQWIRGITNRIKQESTIFGSWLDSFNVVRIFGFNNNNFDNHFILDDLKRVLVGFKFEYSSRYEKVTRCAFVQSTHMSVELVDLVKWIPDKSLREACKDYEEEITTAKLDVNILAYNEAIKKENQFVEECAETEMKIYIKDYMPFIHKKLLSQFRSPTDNTKIRLYDLIVYYCKVDVQSTLELYCILEKQLCNLVEELASPENEIYTSSSDFMDYISIPQLSFEILKETLRKQEEKLLTLNDPRANEFYYASYFGGRVDYGCIGEYIGKEEIEYYDVTSEYSLAMTGYFPSIKSYDDIIVGTQIDLQKYQYMLSETLRKRNECVQERTLHLNNKLIFEELNGVKGIFLCNIYAPEILSTWGPVPLRYNDYSATRKLAYLNCDQFSRALNTVHFRTLILAGWRVELLPYEFNTVFLKIEKNLKPFISLIGKMKSEARLVNKTKAKLLKMLLNSAQGKIAQKPTHLLHLQTGDKQACDDDFRVLSNEKSIEFDWDKSYHYLSSFIGAEAGWILYSASYMLELDYIYDKKPNSERCGAILYCDTDSLIFDSGLVNKNYANFVCDERIGEWNDETSNYDATWKKKYKKIDTVIILAKKSYFLVKKKRLEEKKLKGVLRREAQAMTYDSVKKIIKEGKKQITFGALTKSVNFLKPSCLGDMLRIQSANDTTKRIFDNMVKKTIAVEKDYQKIESTCEMTLLRNKVCLLEGGLNFAINAQKMPDCRNIKQQSYLSSSFSIDEIIESVAKASTVAEATTIGRDYDCHQ
jgi:hypothetical protein